MRARNEVGGRRQLADVELNLAHHPPVGRDLRYHGGEAGSTPSIGVGPTELLWYGDIRQRRASRAGETWPLRLPACG